MTYWHKCCFERVPWVKQTLHYSLLKTCWKSVHVELKNSVLWVCRSKYLINPWSMKANDDFFSLQIYPTHTQLPCEQCHCHSTQGCLWAQCCVGCQPCRTRPVSLRICLRQTSFQLGCTIDDSSLLHSDANRNPHYTSLDKWTTRWTVIDLIRSAKHRLKHNFTLH